MANRRMFCKDVVESERFLSLPTQQQFLYYRLSMNADDEGFLRSVAEYRQLCGCSNEDIQSLCDEGFLLLCPSGHYVIRHWRVNNLIRADRRQKTHYVYDLRELVVDEERVYWLRGTCPEGRECVPAIQGHGEDAPPADNQVTDNPHPVDNQVTDNPHPVDNQVTDNPHPFDNQMTAQYRTVQRSTVKSSADERSTVQFSPEKRKKEKNFSPTAAAAPTEERYVREMDQIRDMIHHGRAAPKDTARLSQLMMMGVGGDRHGALSDLRGGVCPSLPP